MGLQVAALFAGIGGIEVGLHQADEGNRTVFLCESWEPARAVLAARFDAPIDPDVRALRELPPEADTVTAGFPCTDLSQAGRTAGIRGTESGLVTHVLRLLERRTAQRKPISWLVIENVSNMLALEKGEAMRYLTRELETLGFRWAYRVVDSRFTGVPQRRRRVILVASPSEDPRPVLFTEDAGDRPVTDFREEAFGFYWTEGLRGLGWAVDAVPTLKGGSTVGIPSPPGFWVKGATPGRALLMPNLEDAEELQGFPRGWTAPSENGRRNGPRWKLVGNAVTVGVSRWLGEQLRSPQSARYEAAPWRGPGTWPAAAWGEGGSVYQVRVSEFPRHAPYRHLLDVVRIEEGRSISHRGTSGFWTRLNRGNLGRYPGFREAVRDHLDATSPEGADSVAV